MKKFCVFLLILCLCAGCYAPPSPEKLQQILQEGLFNSDNSDDEFTPTTSGLKPVALYDAQGNLYQIGRSTASSYINPFFDLYFAVPEDHYILTDATLREYHSYWQLGDSCTLEMYCAPNDDSVALAIFTEQLELDIPLKQYVINNYTEAGHVRQDSEFSTVTIAEKEFLRFVPDGYEHIYYFYYQDGILLSMELYSAQLHPTAEQTWRFAFFSKRGWDTVDSYIPPIFTADSYESRWLDLAFYPPVSLYWLEEELPDDSYYSLEFSAMSYDEALYMSLTTEPILYDEMTASEYLDIIWDSFQADYPRMKLLQRDKPVIIGGKEFLLLECSEDDFTYRYYVHVRNKRVLILYYSLLDGGEELADITLHYFTPSNFSQSALSHTPYESGILEDQTYINTALNLSIPAENLLFDQDLIDYYVGTEPYHHLDNLGLECMWVMNPQLKAGENCSILLYSEAIEPSSYALYDYFYILQERMASSDYVLASDPGASYLSGKLYVSFWMNDELHSTLRKYFYRLEGDRIFCIVATSSYDRVNILQKSLLELEN